MPLSRSHATHPLRRIGLGLDRHRRVVAADQVQLLAVRRNPQGVRAVIAAAGQVLDPLDIVKTVVAVGVAQSEQPALAAVLRHVQAVEGIQQPLGRGNVDFQSFDPRRLARYRSAAA